MDRIEAALGSPMAGLLAFLVILLSLDLSAFQFFAAAVLYANLSVKIEQTHAQAIEARKGQDRHGLDPKDESAVATPCAMKGTEA